MKLLVLVAAVVLAVSAEKEWTSFKVKYQKSYTNVAEEKLRFSIFQENLKKIEKHNVKYQKGEVSYYLGVNKFADWTSEEFRNMLNLQKANKPKIQGTYAEFKGVQLPESIDWREKGAVLEVKDQGSCGSCWAFSTTGALEAYNVLVNNVSISLSEQDLVDCSRLYENDGCGGGLMTYAFEFVKHHGLTTEESYPYVGVDGTCARDSSKIAVRIDDYKLISHGEEGLKEAVGTIGPISVAIYADEDLSLYAGGVYDDTTCQNNPAMLNHGVLTVGYGSGPGTEGIIEDYWIIKNSWGADWGEDGYFRMIRNPTICGITLDASYPIVTPL